MDGRGASTSRRALLVLTVAVVVLASVVATAGAHGAEGRLVVEVSPGDGPEEAVVGARLHHADDGHPAPDATLTATAVGPEGATVGPVALESGGTGTYRAELVLPAAGRWSVEVVADDPVASATTSYERPAADPVPTSAPDDERPALREDPGDDPAADGVATTADDATDDDEDDSSAAVGAVVVAAVVLAALALLGVTLWRRRMTALGRREDGPAT